MKAKQVDLNGDLIVPKIVKATKTGGGLYLLIPKNTEYIHFTRYIQTDGTICFIPIG